MKLPNDYPPRWRKTPSQFDSEDDRGLEKNQKEAAKEWINPRGDGKDHDHGT